MNEGNEDLISALKTVTFSESIKRAAEQLKLQKREFYIALYTICVELENGDSKYKKLKKIIEKKWKTN